MTQSVNSTHPYAHLSVQTQSKAILRAVFGSGLIWFLVLGLLAALSGCGTDRPDSPVTGERNRQSQPPAGIEDYKQLIVGTWETCMWAGGTTSEMIRWEILSDLRFTQKFMTFKFTENCVGENVTYKTVTGKLVLPNEKSKSEDAYALDEHRVEGTTQTVFYNIIAIRDGGQSLHFGLREERDTGISPENRPYRIAPLGYKKVR
ncbi:MAG: hypothetical protein JNL01_16975 [Bdellovibrionales bacterium]|nr:hypothetical protein [Bdellovibrionales bacterium]